MAGLRYVEQRRELPEYYRARGRAVYWFVGFLFDQATGEPVPGVRRVNKPFRVKKNRKPRLIERRKWRNPNQFKQLLKAVAVAA